MPVATIADLPLELVEEIACHLDVKDVAKLMRVNKRLYSSYATDQSIVFGKHVAVIVLGQSSEPKNWIKKFVDSPSFQLNATLLPFVKRIDSCGTLDISLHAERIDGMSLDQLKSVNQLVFDVGRKEGCLRFLTNFYGSVKKNATLRIRIGSFEKDQAMKELLGKFIENQLNGCEKIILYCSHKDCFHVYHKAMMKTQIKMITICTSSLEFDQIVYWTVNQGVPSKNSEAVGHITTDQSMPIRQTDVIRTRIGGFLSQVQRLERVDDGQNHPALVARANELLRGQNENVFYYIRRSMFDENSLCFRRRIDSKTSCIYLFHTESLGLQFLAFYMPSQ